MISFNGIKNTIASFNLINIHLNNSSENRTVIENSPSDGNKNQEITEVKEYVDYKSSLGGWSFHLISKMDGELMVYLFIQKHKNLSMSAWNLVCPIIIEKNTQKEYYFGLGCFALEGIGGGIGKTETLLKHLEKHRNKGNKVYILPKVIDNELLDSYGYLDSGLKLTDLIDNSVDLVNYQSKEFEHIYSNFLELEKSVSN